MMSALAPLALAVPLLAAALVAAVSRFLPRWVTSVMSIAAALFCTVACIALALHAARDGTVVHWFGGWTPRHGIALGIAFVVDPAGGALAAFAALLTTASFSFAWTYYEEAEGAFHALMLVFLASLTGFFLTGDLFNLFVFFELMSVSAYALTGYKCEDESAVEGALAFGIVNSAGAFFVLIGIALLYARTGALAMAQVAHALGGAADPLVVAAFALIVLGFLVKAAVVPFHFWLSDAHAVAPTPLCVLFSGIMVQAGLYAAARIDASVFGGIAAVHAPAVRDVLIAIGVVTAFVGAVMSFAQRHLKRLLAFSTISHSGILLCAFGLFGPRALGGLLLYILGHGLIKGGLFMCSGIILNRFESVDVEALRARLRELPWVAAALTAGALGLAGLPAFGTFAGKALIDDAAKSAGLAWLPPLLLVAAAITGASVLNATGRLTFGWGPPPDPEAQSPEHEPDETEGRELPFVAFVPAAVLLVLSFALGLVRGMPPVAAVAGARFLDRAQQLAVVIGGAPGTPLPSVAPVPLGKGIAFGAAAAALALAFAACALFGHRATRLWPRVQNASRALLHPLRAVHSGIVTDYVAWLTTGLAALGVAFAVAMR